MTSDKQMTLLFLFSSQHKPVAYQFSIYHSYVSVSTAHDHLSGLHIVKIIADTHLRITLPAGVFG
jgi:hypothetical protein